MHPPGDPGFELLRHKARTWNVPLHAIRDRGPWDWRVAHHLLKICRHERVAIWHGHDYKSNALGLLLRPFWPMRLVTTVHGWVKQTSRTPLYYRIDRECLPHYERVICVSDDLRDRSLECGVEPGRCLVLDNAIDTSEYFRRHSIADAKRRLGFSPDRLLVGSIGRLSAEKGFPVLIDAVDCLLSHGFDFELCIAGDGDEDDRLRALISRIGRQDRIHLLGYRADTIALYEAMDVFALSSLREGLPNVLLEAMALEVPVVATRIAGVPRLIETGINGLLAEPGSIDDLRRALEALLTDPALRARLGQGGRKTIVDRHDFPTRIKTLGRMYDELLELS